MFSRLSVSRKIQVLGLVPLALFLLIFFAYLLPIFGTRFMAAKKEGARSVVDMGYSFFADLEARVKKGELSLEQAQAQGRTGIMSMRYEGNNYLWIASPGARIVAHPIKAELAGKDMSASKDANGKLHWQAMDQVAQQPEGGFVGYDQQLPDGKVRSKVSYIRRFQPWGWDLATGVYVDDVQAQIRAMAWSTGIPLAVPAKEVVHPD